MKKFGEIYKDKVNESKVRQESKVLGDFRIAYNTLLEHYGLTSIHQLDDKSQLSFLTELNHYWSEEEGLSEKGKIFIQKRSLTLNENSTVVQKKNFFKEKANIIINESLRQINLKNKLYDIIDEMYKQVKASDVSDVLTPDTITNIISEAFIKYLNDFNLNINTELKESIKPKRKYIVK